MTEGLSTWARGLLERPRTFATLATVNADGTPHQAVIWYAIRGQDVLVNSRIGRVWPANLQRTGRFSLMVEEGYDWVSLRGEAETLDDPEQAREDIIAMARVYHAAEPEKAERAARRFRTQDRISFLLHPTAVTEHPDDQ